MTPEMENLDKKSDQVPKEAFSESAGFNWEEILRTDSEELAALTVEIEKREKAGEKKDSNPNQRITPDSLIGLILKKAVLQERIEDGKRTGGESYKKWFKDKQAQESRLAAESEKRKAAATQRAAADAEQLNFQRENLATLSSEKVLVPLSKTEADMALLIGKAANFSELREILMSSYMMPSGQTGGDLIWSVETAKRTGDYSGVTNFAGLRDKVVELVEIQKKEAAAGAIEKFKRGMKGLGTWLMRKR